MKILFILIAAILFNTGCLTGALTSQINKQEEAGREWRDVILKGRESGEVKYKNLTYKRYEFCGFQKDPGRVLEVLIPTKNGTVVLREHRNYSLEGSLPIVLETGFGVEHNFKGRFYHRVNFEGEKISVPPPEENEKTLKPKEETQPNFNFLPQVQNNQLNNDRVEDLQEILRKGMIHNDFYRPEGSKDKWYLMTTRVEVALDLSKRTGTRFFISTPERSYTVDAEEMHYDYRSWFGNKLMKAGYVITVPADIVVTPVIAFGVLCTAAIVNIFD